MQNVIARPLEISYRSAYHQKDDKRENAFKTILKKGQLKKAYITVLEKYGFKNIKFHTDPFYPDTVLFISMEK
ncbi:MAG: hypothetical protein K2X94_01400 [Amoebophilaceae bacterium]|nr:hypothetical protein [Amoebophilaceae bacterium]